MWTRWLKSPGSQPGHRGFESRHPRHARVVQRIRILRYERRDCRFESYRAYQVYRPVVQWTGRNPPKVAIGVRVAAGRPGSVRWGSLESPPPCHGEDHGFKSHTHRQFVRLNSTGEQKLAFQVSQVGSTPTGLTKICARSSKVELLSLKQKA
jgi:hypothetical protein